MAIIARDQLDATLLNTGSTIAVAKGGTGATATTGTGNNVLSTSPTLITPALGTPSAVVLTNATSVPVNQATGIIPSANLPAATTTAQGAVTYATAAQLASRSATAVVTAAQNGRVLLSSGSVSAASTVNITSAFSTTFPMFELVLDSIIPSTNDVSLNFRVSTDNGSTYLSTAIYAITINSQASNSATTTRHDFAQQATAGQINAAGVSYGLFASGTAYVGNAIMRFHNPSSSGWKNVETLLLNPTSATASVRADAYTNIQTTTAINALTLYTNTGTVSLNYRLYGVI